MIHSASQARHRLKAFVSLIIVIFSFLPTPHSPLPVSFTSLSERVEASANASPPESSPFVLPAYAPNQAGEPLVAQVILETPSSLTPPFISNDRCGDGWYSYPDLKPRGYPFYLTLNTNDDHQSQNYGEWRPTFSQPGYYKVEAFIPQHPSLIWPDCGNLSASFDTTEAHYTVHYSSTLTTTATTTVIRNQMPISNTWMSLGEFPFNSGNSGTVSLSDFNQEANMSSTVSFSAMSFTWTRPLTSTPPVTTTAYMPIVLQNARPGLTIELLWTGDATRIAREYFLFGNSIHFYSQGVNGTQSAITVQAKLDINGRCDNGTLVNQTLVNRTLTLPRGRWSVDLATLIPSCTGTFDYSLDLIDNAHIDASATGRFVVTNVNKHAFDKCNLPDLAAMGAWWNNSPYYGINLYIGGVARGCANANMDATWIQTAASQGWFFIPTWVGPQAPCTNFRYRMSSNSTTAKQQGRQEADAAVAAANRLGLPRNSIIYYDMEGFGFFASDACKDTVSSFIEGWSARLKELGHKSGAYGSAASSHMQDWVLNNPILDSVWIASWVSEEYDSNATVWDVSYLENKYWSNHQRIRQYAGGHVESWGGYAYSIDSNVVDGPIVTMPTSAASSLAYTQTGLPFDARSPFVTTTQLQDIQLLSAETGWVLVNGHFFWTEDGGNTWEERYLPGPKINPLLSAQFTNLQEGWVVKQPVSLLDLPTVVHTSDGGLSWQDLSPLPSDRPLEAPVSGASLAFVDSQNGWLALALQTSSSFSLGRLFHTTNGGITWTEQRAPVGGKIQFEDALHGWLRGGIDGEELYRTTDGGSTWQIAGDQVMSSLLSIPGTVNIQVPPGVSLAQVQLPASILNAQFIEPEFGWALVQNSECSGNKTPLDDSELSTVAPFQCASRVSLVKTSDGGLNWTEIFPMR